MPNAKSSQAAHYDTIVIGSGQAGTPLSQALAAAGMRTALVEREHVGGTCINEGCTPTKTMVASGRVAYLARRGADYGVRTGPIRVDMLRVRKRKRILWICFAAEANAVWNAPKISTYFSATRNSPGRVPSLYVTKTYDAVVNCGSFFH